MTDKRRLINAVFIVALPVVVAPFGLSVWTTLLLVLLFKPSGLFGTPQVERV